DTVSPLARRSRGTAQGSHVTIEGMNKAFVREPDTTGPARCPRCGSQGTLVSGATLDAWLSEGARRMMPDSANFCPYPRCEVVYFDHFERVITADEIERPVYPKD